MSSYTTALQPVNHEAEVAELQSNIDDLVARMSAALDAIAEAAGAWHCEHCGEWTIETIDVPNYSDEMGYEMECYCPRCVPAGVEVN